jgi:hypothetical protein
MRTAITVNGAKEASHTYLVGSSHWRMMEWYQSSYSRLTILPLEWECSHEVKRQEVGGNKQELNLLKSVRGEMFGMVPVSVLL